MGCTVAIGGAITTYPHKFSPKIFFSPWGMHLHPRHPGLRLWM